MKFLKISSINNQYIDSVEKLLLSQKNQSYDNLSLLVFDQLLDNSNFYSQNLIKKGLCEAADIITNIPGLQIAWYKDKNKKHSKSIWQFILDTIDYYKPDVVYDQGYVLKGKVPFIKNKYPFIRQIVSWDCYTKSPSDGRMGYDIYFTCLESIRNSYLKNNQKCYLNPFGFEGSILNKVTTPKERINKVCFTGSLISNVHKYRFEVLNELRKCSYLDWWVGNLGEGFLTKSKARELVYGNFISLYQNFPFELKNKGAVFGKKMYEILSQYSSCINVHGNEISEIGNMRLTEASGMGTCQIIDWKSNAHSYFEPDVEAVFFKSIPELLEKAKYLIENPKVAREIGKKGQQRTLKEHTMENHVVRMWEAIKENL